MTLCEMTAHNDGRKGRPAGSGGVNERGRSNCTHHDAEAVDVGLEPAHVAHDAQPVEQVQDQRRLERRLEDVAPLLRVV